MLSFGFVSENTYAICFDLDLFQKWQRLVRKNGTSFVPEIENSTRPNRVTGAGFWKATGTDRPIYSADGVQCIGLKKSLVFYKGRSAKGIKTDWMMTSFDCRNLATSQRCQGLRNPIASNGSNMNQ
ncbi:hypothetical protein O6H91_11G069900 [Diphasiastrum complanatum]|uniref:Uncharacterized protein n=1 Tax=Diphasiastrum complanatum TaxID=34168 RepID=A0ACC2CA74_DIPCM|nr:hypothetical protein O6H91_11G069900 [Diphasiastrum complanatum]